jgi:hypothetical protein
MLSAGGMDSLGMFTVAGVTIFLNTQQPCIFWVFSFWASEVVVVKRINRIRRDFRWCIVVGFYGFVSTDWKSELSGYY